MPAPDIQLALHAGDESNPASREALEEFAVSLRTELAALAEANAIEGAKEGVAEQRRRSAIAEATEREGTAEASAILARGQAEAEAVRRKADAFSEYGEAAILDLLVRVLPQVVSAASAPMGAIDKMTVISTEGASSLSRTVASNVAQGLQLGTDLTGINLAALLARLGAAGSTGGNGQLPAKPAGTVDGGTA